MNFSTRHAFGIVVGVAVTIVAANALNMFLNWETAAIVCGLLLGLEAGFWAGVPGLTREVHARIFRGLLSNEFWSAIKTTAYYVTAIAGISLAIFTAIGTTTWLFHQPWVLSWFTDGADAENNCGMVKISAVVFAFIVTIVSEVALSDRLVDRSHRRLECGLLHLPIGLAIGLVMPVAVPLICAVVALMFGLIGILCIVLLAYCLLMVAARYEVATITIGVIVGGISGLCYGRWTQLAFVPTTLSIMVGATVGLTSAYAAYRIGRKLQAVNKPATATAS